MSEYKVSPSPTGEITFSKEFPDNQSEDFYQVLKSSIQVSDKNTILKEKLK